MNKILRIPDDRVRPRHETIELGGGDDRDEPNDAVLSFHLHGLACLEHVIQHTVEIGAETSGAHAAGDHGLATRSVTYVLHVRSIA